MPRGYIRQVLAFPSSDRLFAIKLREGLDGVIKDVPYLLCGVVSDDVVRGSVSLTEPYQTPDDLFSWQDLSFSLDYASLRRSNFTPGAFDMPDLLPPETVPPFQAPSPVFRARLSVATGGFVLCVAVHHTVTDITGFGSLLGLWASYCRSGSSAPIRFDQTWLDRRSLSGYLRPTAERPRAMVIPKLLHIRQATSHITAVSNGGGSQAEYKSGIFFFSLKSLQEVKQVVNYSIAVFEPDSWVSTNDIITTVLWCALIEAEMLGSDAQSVSAIGFPVNFRPRLNPPLPRGYLGAAFMMTTAKATIEDLLSYSTEGRKTKDKALGFDWASSLARTALKIRKSINAVDTDSVREVLEYLDDHTDDVQPIVLGPRHGGISIVSWADQEVYQLDWGEVIGCCEAVRLPRPARKRYPIILPRVPDSHESGGGFEVFVSLEEAAFKRFERSWPISQLAELRCAA